MMKRSLLAVFLCLGLVSIQCGYSTRSSLPSDFRTIHVDYFKNNILYSNENNRNLYLPLLEVKVRNSIINRFQFDGNLKITDPDKADLILKGELKGYQRGELRYTDNNDVLEYRVSIIVSLELFNTNKQETVWKEPDFIGEATYFVSGAQAKSEDAAVEEATIDLARRIVERTIENW